MFSWVILKIEAFLLLFSWFNVASASNCHRIDDQFTFYTGHDLSQFHIYTGEKIIYAENKDEVLLLLSQNGHFALDPYNMSTKIRINMPYNLNEKKILNRDDACAKSKAITQFGSKHLHATSDDNMINFCLYESNLPNAPLTRIDYTNPTILLVYNANDTKSYSLAVRPMCNSIFPNINKPFINITAMTYVKSSSHGKPNRPILHIAFVDEYDRKDGLIYHGICTFDVNDLISKMNDPKAKIVIRHNNRWEYSTIDWMQKSSSRNPQLIGILNETFPSLSPNSKARLNYKFNNSEEIKMHVVLANVDDDGQFYDKHFIYTSIGNIYMGITSQNLNSSFRYICNVGMDFQEISIWNRKRLILKSKYKIISLPLSNCQSYSCSECYEFKDPSCVFNSATKFCMNRMFINETMKPSIKTIMHNIDSSKICAPNVEQGLSQDLLKEIQSEIIGNITNLIKELIKEIRTGQAYDANRKSNDSSSILTFQIFDSIQNLSNQIANQNILIGNQSQEIIKLHELISELLSQINKTEDQNKLISKNTTEQLLALNQSFDKLLNGSIIQELLNKLILEQSNQTRKDENLNQYSTTYKIPFWISISILILILLVILIIGLFIVIKREAIGKWLAKSNTNGEPEVVNPNGPEVVNPNGPEVVNPNGPEVVNPNGPEVVNPNEPAVVDPSDTNETELKEDIKKILRALTTMQTTNENYLKNISALRPLLEESGQNDA